MQQVRTSVWPNLLKFINGFSSNQDFRVVKSVSDFGLTKASPDFTARSVSSLVKKSLAGRIVGDRLWTRACANSSKQNFQNIFGSLSVCLMIYYTILFDRYKVFNLALKSIKDDHQVRSKIGSPITGYGQESRHRAARQRIPNKVWTDDNGIEHVEINFYIRGLHGAGKFYTEMFKDKEYRKWKYTVLVVEIRSPTQSNIILESYLPSLKTT